MVVAAEPRQRVPEEGEERSMLTAAVVQLNAQDDVRANLARVRHWITEAAGAGARLVALPENFAFMGSEENKRALAEDLDGANAGPIVSAVREAAMTAGVFVVAGGMPERNADEGRPFNTSLLVGPDGALLARYRKIHLFDVDLSDGTSLKESAATTSGAADGLVVTEAAGTLLGMSVCYDLRFPELYRALGRKGARVVTVPSAFTLTTGKDHWHVLLRARAIENQVFVLAPAQTGKHPRGRQTYGKSLIADPWGDVLAQCGEGEGFAVARLDFALQDKVRASLPCLTHTRMA
jgi:predicted amidohydrolase